MALMDLLTVGRSLSEARDRPHRFKLLSGALPKFGNAAATHGNLQVGQFCGSNARRSEAAERMGNDTMKSATIAEEQKQAVPASMHAFPAGRWTLNPFKTAVAPGPRPAVQGELSLEKIKPVRNDLNDSDLELVAVSQRPEPVPGVVQVGSLEVPVVQTKSLWHRVRQLFRKAR